MNQLLVQYSYLQILDFLTTIAFLLHGVREANPLVRLALHVGPSPFGGLLLVKTAAIALGIYCWKAGRDRVLTRMNIMFALVVAWNIAALILSSTQTGAL
jgi:hypothetical protein